MELLAWMMAAAARRMLRRRWKSRKSKVDFCRSFASPYKLVQSRALRGVEVPQPVHVLYCTSAHLCARCIDTLYTCLYLYRSAQHAWQHGRDGHVMTRFLREITHIRASRGVTVRGALRARAAEFFFACGALRILDIGYFCYHLLSA